jgi:uncharacterized protein YjiS (DUF1127 family)
MAIAISSKNTTMFDATSRRSYVRTVLDRLVRLLQRLRGAARRRVARMLRPQAVRALRLLDDRLLADIGLRRDDIAFALRLDDPFHANTPELTMLCRASLQS